jgi:unsaturated chondroitin disaccharide hydrolase
MIKIDYRLKPEDLKKKLDLFWELSAEKIKHIDKNYDGLKGCIYC